MVFESIQFDSKHKSQKSGILRLLVAHGFRFVSRCGLFETLDLFGLVQAEILATGARILRIALVCV